MTAGEMYSNKAMESLTCVLAGLEAAAAFASRAAPAVRDLFAEAFPED